MSENPELNELGIRRLTGKEVGRLMGVKDDDIDRIMEHQTLSGTYVLFGNSIVVTCLMAIFGQLIDEDWQKHFKPEEWWNNKEDKNDNNR